jgi:S1-C subfamily serine protease
VSHSAAGGAAVHPKREDYEYELDEVLGAMVGIRALVPPSRSVVANVIAKQEYAGYWEYLLEEAIYTAPAHPFWGGTALIGPSGELLGIGSLQIQAVSADPEQPLPRRSRQSDDANMIVPIDLLKPVLNDLATIGRPNRPARPWLGLYATEIGSSVALLGAADRGPAELAGLREGDIVLAVAGGAVSSLAELFRRVWALGEAGVAIPLTINREGRTFEVAVHSTDRRKLLKGPVLH